MQTINKACQNITTVCRQASMLHRPYIADSHGCKTMVLMTPFDAKYRLRQDTVGSCNGCTFYNAEGWSVDDQHCHLILLMLLTTPLTYPVTCTFSHEGEVENCTPCSMRIHVPAYSYCVASARCDVVSC